MDTIMQSLAELTKVVNETKQKVEEKCSKGDIEKEVNDTVTSDYLSKFVDTAKMTTSADYAAGKLRGPT